MCIYIYTHISYIYIRKYQKLKINHAENQPCRLPAAYQKIHTNYLIQEQENTR